MPSRGSTFYLEPHHSLVKEQLAFVLRQILIPVRDLFCRNSPTSFPPNAGESADYHGGGLIRVRLLRRLRFASENRVTGPQPVTLIGRAGVTEGAGVKLKDGSNVAFVSAFLFRFPLHPFSTGWVLYEAFSERQEARRKFSAAVVRPSPHCSAGDPLYCS